MASTRSQRQEIILGLIAGDAIHNQTELLEALAAAGVSMTQSTLSRELKALGVAKAPDGNGGYRYIAGTPLEGPLAKLVAFVTSIECAENLIVIKTPPGGAQGVARGIDEANWDEVMGCIAGDDTILLICRGAARAKSLEKRLRSITRR